MNVRTLKIKNLELRNSGKHRKYLMETINNPELTSDIIAAAITVHRELGPGFLESIYEEALCVELNLLGIPYERQKPIEILYRNKKIGEHRLDIFVDNTVVVELKAIRALEDIHFSTVRSYMKACKVESGLLLNFATMPLTIKRVGREWLPSATTPDED